jgi:magnesium chelatase family protein
VDILVHMPRPTAEQLANAAGTSSSEVRAAVLAARERQGARLAGTGLTTNAELTPRLLGELIRADAGAHAALQRSYAKGDLSARGHGRVLRVARTIADLAGSARVRAAHVNEALSLRHEEVLEGAQAA